MLETRKPGVLYHQSRDGTSAKQVRVAEAGPERKLQKALLRGVLRPAQLPAEKTNERAGAMQRLRDRSSMRLPTVPPVRQKHAKNEAFPQKRKSEKRFSACFARAARKKHTS